MRATVSCIFCLIFVSLSLSIYSLERGYGDWPKDYPLHPAMRERRILVLTNACRISPTEYRDALVVPFNSMASGILLPANYPPTFALYWQVDLNRVAKKHAVDMANNHGLSHSSSDGTSFQNRVNSYYTKSQRVGENIACGSKEAFGSMRQWILDIIDTNDTPAPDNSGDDGHRKGIMNSRFKELGSGYAKGPIRWYYFWVQDFGGGNPEFDNPISAGAHFVLSGNNTQFMCTYTDPNNGDPKSGAVVIDNQEHNLTVLFGDKKKGTYDIKIPTAGDCRYYYFKFIDSQNKAWRHPEFGRLITLGEGSCDKEYEYPDEIIFSSFKGSSSRPFYTVHVMKPDKIVLNTNGKSVPPKLYTIVNCKGQEIQRSYWTPRTSISTKRKLIIPLKHQLYSGIYFLSLYAHDSEVYFVKLYVSDM